MAQQPHPRESATSPTAKPLEATFDDHTTRQLTKTMMTQRYKNIILTLILTLVGTLNSIACSCEGEGTVSGSVKYSDVVFSGQVISMTLTNNDDSLGVVVTGDTSKMYKGQLVSDTLTILTPPNGAACGYYFQVGQKYIVYATVFDEMLGTSELKRRTFDNKTFWTHQCTRTQNWNTTEENDIIKETK